ncbi:CotY/CotZ family spore coat protein [Priestia taiwanensis]|uniref:CotY/CotZ family spore coat protein n=1 Tax=Priestia taiwanensis TaxID=1347902 RepID=UPI001665EB50|nr:CotY/CotZ family spore coat protein [Priestia taiwanensis]MBM7364117.1 spore coat protein Z [Priestia taiwanensis]
MGSSHSGSGSCTGSGSKGKSCHSCNGSCGSGSCVCDVVCFINDLQDCANSSCCSNGCDLPFLGANPSLPIANTRPFTLLNKNGCPFEAFFSNTGATTGLARSFIFRVESIDGCCAVLRVLAVALNGTVQNPSEPGTALGVFLNNPASTLVGTNTCITVDLCCFCGIQCLRDVALPCM